MVQVNIGGGFAITSRMLDLFKRPDDPTEHNYLYALPALALAASYAVAHFLGVAAPIVTSGVYLVASALCISSIACLSHQATARTGMHLHPDTWCR